MNGRGSLLIKTRPGARLIKTKATARLRALGRKDPAASKQCHSWGGELTRLFHQDVDAGIERLQRRGLVLVVEQHYVHGVELHAAGQRVGQRAERRAWLARDALDLLAHLLGPREVEVDADGDVDEIGGALLDAVPVDLADAAAVYPAG